MTQRAHTIFIGTRMHYSRMRTVCLGGVCPEGWGCLPGVCLPRSGVHLPHILIITARKRSSGQGNIFCTCLSFCSQRGLPQCMLGYPPKRTPPVKETPPSPAKETPCQGDTPAKETPPTTKETPRRLLLRAIRILLECILVC